MPKAARKFYAVAVGRDGPKIYTTWDECKEKITRYPSALYKSFPSQKQADEWLASKVDSRARSRPASDLVPPDITMLPPRDPPVSQEWDEEDSLPLSEPPSVSLSSEQQEVLDRVKQGRSVFFTGSAGTGKSVLLREIIKTLQERGGLAITASTGIAAVNIGGSTLHSWAGIGLGDESWKQYAGKFFGQKKFRPVLDRWRNVRTLIIDEVSMIDGALFDKLENIAREVRHNEKPFGGIQLVLSGDFCQLPPVPGRDKKGQQITPVFAFDAKTWHACVGSPVMLTRVFRQKDEAFVDMLNAMRFGQIDAKAVAAFSTLSRKVEYADGIEPTELFSTRQEVDNANASRLRQLNTESHTYVASDYAGVDSNGHPITPMQMSRLLERLVVQKQIHLKVRPILISPTVLRQALVLQVGAQVMLVKNLVQGSLVNGSVGQVMRFSTAEDALKEHTNIAGVDRGERPRLPPSGFVWPIVRFIGGQETMIIPQEFTINNANGETEARRDQVPLILAWALSVHKSQGQTLERVKVDLRRTFEKGQAYVALSRATCLEQLQVLNFDASKVQAHPRVLEWHFGRRPATTSANEVIELFDSDEEADSDVAMSAYYNI
ncbi:putative dna repair and recombination [Lyophyllum shimeji]|uniref:ATP-dependent DNA helicase PIF1 n=1 Tax=Lyophyllum shimeji TaxID=47721 RepID=A0A9P3UJ47_LYOSH|nr:putative dna repair and recombination [Lyophyllum shimeji]